MFRLRAVAKPCQQKPCASWNDNDDDQTDYTDKPLSLSDYGVKLLEDVNYSY